MSVSLEVWYRDGRSEAITAPVYGAAFDTAANRGAIRAVDGQGGVFRWIDGEWVFICQGARP